MGTNIAKNTVKEVFNRYEKKYLVDGEICERLCYDLSAYMQPDPYNKDGDTYMISNIYYDTVDSHLIRSSLAKPSYKEKLRLRSYGTPAATSRVYAEIKKKYCGIVNKRRSAMLLDEAYRFLETGQTPVIQPYMNRQVMSEIQYMLSGRTVLPMLYLAYERKAFFGIDDEELRVSFDTAITTRREDLRLEAGCYGKQLLPEGQWLMEIKTAGALPVWLIKLLSGYQVYPHSFSKYGTEFRQHMATSTANAKGAVMVPKGRTWNEEWTVVNA
ncbi:MAG: polyphosphate polymerase domain-containing protein [Lachnospiraceae bacterium]|jgi:hypothetical protein|nr:polyphosphate polymerase domain-containing protein [Lachnospiraceae bacterium]